MEQMDWIIATFEPTDRSNLQTDVVGLVGVTAAWQALWVIEDGTYEDQWALMCWDRTVWPPGCWVPLCDLREVTTGWERHGDIVVQTAPAAVTT